MKNLWLFVIIILSNFIHLSAQQTLTNQNTNATDSLAQSLQINGYQRILTILVVSHKE